VSAVRLIETDDCIRLGIIEEGPADAPAVLFAHSVGCNLTLWDEQAMAVTAAGWRAIRYDSRGHGRSDAPRGDYALERLGRDALNVLDAAGAGRAQLCGLSLGGTVGMWLAANAPDRLHSLILCDTAARLGTPEIWRSRAEGALTGGMESIADLSMTRFFSDAFRAARPDTVARFRQGFVHTPAHGYAGCCAVLRDADLEGALARIAVPTLVIGGLHDFPTPPRDAEHLADAIPGAALVLLDTGHLSNIEDPQGFNAALLNHLRETA
jgi:3-oxoadipate enol-lactonase